MHSLKKLTLFPAPAAYMARYKPQPGYDWSTWGMYEGENRNRGASYSFFINPGDKSDTTKKLKADSATVKIYTQNNELMRTIKMKVDTGFNRKNWGFEMKGIRQPNTPKPKADEPEPRGNTLA